MKALLEIGFKNTVSIGRVIAIVGTSSAPIKRAINDARDSGKLIDAAGGRRTRAAIFMDSGHIVLSWVQPSTLAERIEEA